MATYRIVTPDTPRVPGKPYADFESGQTIVGPFEHVKPLITAGCAVWKRKHRHWQIIIDRTMEKLT